MEIFKLWNTKKKTHTKPSLIPPNMEKIKLAVHVHPLYHVGGNQIQGNEGFLFWRRSLRQRLWLLTVFAVLSPQKMCRVRSSDQPSSHPEHPLQLLVGSESNGKRCHLCGVDLDTLCYHCSICDFTLDTGCAINPPLPIIEKPKAHEHSLTLTSSTDFTCHVCDEKAPFPKFLYICSVCDLFFHAECASLPPEINHPSHPRGHLKFIKGGLSINPCGDCTLCGKNIEPHGNFYHCSICNFTVDLRCVRNPQPLALVSPRTHKHELNCMPRRIKFTCNACGMQGDQSPYVCIQCNFMVHRSCIDLPRVIWINRHDHRISHTYDLHDIGNLDLECGVCRQAIDPSYGAYSCFECKIFIVHSRCATNRYIWDGRDLEEEPEEIEDVSPFEVIGYNLIKHFSHAEHDMKLIEEGSMNRETIACKACIKPISDERFYKCMQCDFSLHEVCANLLRKIRSVLHEQKLILVEGASCVDDTFSCFICKRYSSGFRYRHEVKEFFVVDLQCSLTRESLKREAHPHLLYFTTKDSVNCNSCKQEAPYGFECFQGDCEFSLCFNCASFPERVKHKADDHTLRLCYQEYGNGKYWCDICEKEVDSHKQYYTCDDCGTTFHIKCVLGDIFGSISSGSKFMSTSRATGRDYEFEVVPNIGVNRPLCCECDSRCTFSLVPKIHGDPAQYVCSKYCLLK